MKRPFLALFWLSLAYWGAALLLPALPGVPLNDDWSYASTAYGFAREGAMRLSDWGTPTLVVQAAWGAIFCRIHGVGPSALRLSTLALGWIGGLAFYFIARRARLARGLETELAALLLFSPLYFVLSPSFMTDVPALSLGLVGLALAWPGLEDARPRRLAIGSIFFALAYGIRQNALLWPAALTFYLWTRKRLDRRSVAGLWGFPLAALAAYQFWYRWVHGATLNDYQLVFGAPDLPAPWPAIILVRAAVGALYAGLFALPISAAIWADHPLKRFTAAPRRLRLIALGAAAFPIVVPLLGGSLPLPRVPSHGGLFGSAVFDVCSYVTASGLGCYNIEGASSRFSVPWLSPILTALALLSWATLAAVWVLRRRPAAQAVVWPLVLIAVSTLPAKSFFDRYWLPLAPAVLAAGASGLTSSKRSLWILRLSALACGLIVWAATADYLRSTEAAWRLGETAVDRGFSPIEIKASSDWCLAHEWTMQAERLKTLGVRDLAQVPATCLRQPRLIVSFTAKPRQPRPVLASVSFFSPLTLRTEPLYLYLYR
jgi:hypothetical protein